MKKAYLGIDIGSISTKGVVINEHRKILAQEYLMTECKPIETVTKLLEILKEQMKNQPYQVVTVGTTGSARKLIGAITEAAVIKNEITAHAIGTISLHPEVRTIFEIGGQDSKIILIENGVVVDYAMNTLCAAGTGSFLASQAHRIGVAVEDFGKVALTSTNPTSLAARCTVFAESDLVHKAQMGHQTKDIIAGLCHSVVRNYLNNVGKGKKIVPPIVFQGGVSKNEGVKKAFEEITGHKVLVDENGHLTGALGTAILAQKSGEEKPFTFEMLDMDFTTKGIDCEKCANHCEIMCVYRNNTLIDAWGNKCEQGAIRN
ncbi:acyl-CoA dehydratase activase [Tindallia californiensis]|uniref:CoA-substrate-specific enzyme activase, putative n=1 Tax=Tindallia californiensis TaxID=159292 RepID=A0A1H3Q5X6_9FIRM|nr:acyl-CoA dehydratase activase [Tindallia californiensis]SDZ08643.1 CoA-substrate-specific enzyme activase, putative [Tindallia californiensis]